MIPDEAIELALIANWDTEGNQKERMRAALEAAAPYMMADILEDAANTAETDELTTAAEVIYDLRRHAKDLRPTNAR